MKFSNQTALDDTRLRQMFLRHTAPYDHEPLSVVVRHTRSTPFSGTCYYNDSRIHVNLGRRNRYPMTLGTHVAKATTGRQEWSREIYSLTVGDPYQLALFIYLHELFHFLVNASGRGRLRKEAMCDRFAARVLVDVYGCRLLDPRGAVPPRQNWDFKDLHLFVARAPQGRPAAEAARRFIPVRIVGPNFGGDEQLRG